MTADPTGDRPSPRHPPDSRYTVLYDGHCGVCRRSAEILRRWDRQGLLEVIPSSDPGARERFPWIEPDAYDRSLQLVGPSGRTWEGAAALEQLLRLMPRGRLLRPAFDVPPVRALVDRVYRAFARNRARLGCSRHCAPGSGDE